MYKERDRGAEFMKGDRPEFTDRQMLRLLEEIRADVRALRERDGEKT